MSDGQGDELEAGELVELERQGDEVIVTASGGHLRPFRKGDGRAAEAGRRGAAVREARRAIVRGEVDAVATHLRMLAGSYEREELGPIAAAAALDAIGRVQRGEWKVRDPADWVRVLVDVARLEAGQPTSTSLVAHVGREAAAGVLALREQARAALGEATAVAADADGGAVVASPVGSPPVGGSGAVGGGHGRVEQGG